MAKLGEVQKWAARVDTLTQRISEQDAEADSQAVYIRKLQNENGEYLQGKKQAEKKVLELEEELSMIYSQQARVAELEAERDLLQKKNDLKNELLDQFEIMIGEVSSVIPTTVMSTPKMLQCLGYMKRIQVECEALTTNSKGGEVT